jgi:cobalt/nickel transport system permease protein
MVGSLMLRSIERSERVYQAMAARGYTGQVRSLARPQMRRQDYLALLGCAVLLVSIVLLSNSLT